MNRRSHPNVSGLLIALALLALAGCTPPVGSQLDRAIDEFHANFRAGNYLEIYKGGSPSCIVVLWKKSLC
jgi:hypothetical protein